MNLFFYKKCYRNKLYYGAIRVGCAMLPDVRCVKEKRSIEKPDLGKRIVVGNTLV